jgi:hypothetical protein
VLARKGKEKSIRFEISDRILEEAIIQLEKKYANLWYGIWFGIVWTLRSRLLNYAN